MFTGLVETVGTVVNVTAAGEGTRLKIRCPQLLDDAQHGASIAVSGVCLTVVDFDRECFSVDVMRQTLDVSTIGALKPGDHVNLERATKFGARLGGHIVQGHVDAVARVIQVRQGDKWRVIRFAVASEIARLLVDKGAVCVAGVSLTVSGLSDPLPSESATEGEYWFEVSLIPETLTATTLGELAVGDRINLETDVIARHVARLASFMVTTETAGE